MNLILILFVITFCGLTVALDQEALRECGNVHKVDIHHLKNVNATFEGKGCAVKCFIDDQWRPSEPINDGFPCPTDSNGICNKGDCGSRTSYAVSECSQLLSPIHFEDINHSGTGYINDICTLVCAIEGHPQANFTRNEDFSCMAGAGICKKGLCEMNIKDVPTTTIAPMPTQTINSEKTTTLSPTTITTLPPIKGMHLTIEKFMVNNNFTNLYAAACIVPSSLFTKKNRNDFTFSDCISDVCFTTKIPTAVANHEYTNDNRCPYFKIEHPEKSELCYGVFHDDIQVFTTTDSMQFVLNYQPRYSVIYGEIGNISLSYVFD